VKRVTALEEPNPPVRIVQGQASRREDLLEGSSLHPSGMSGGQILECRTRTAGREGRSKSWKRRNLFECCEMKGKSLYGSSESREGEKTCSLLPCEHEAPIRPGSRIDREPVSSMTSRCCERNKDYPSRAPNSFSALP
jgi:hypothetical protein